MPQPDDATLLAAYRRRVASGQIADDAAQRAIVVRLDGVLTAIGTHRLARKSSALGWLFARKGDAGHTPRGLYVHGSVGRGKTMLMDMFFEHVHVNRKRRAHFNDFMSDVHERIHAHRQKLARGETREKDPVPPVAAQLFEEAWVLCFDEFSVTDIADAMLLSRLFEQLFNLGCVLVSTSNVAPDDLYRDGLNRQLFMPFVGLLKRHVDVASLDADTDYRLQKTLQLPVFHLLDGAFNEGMDNAWQELTTGRNAAPAQIAHKGRTIEVPQAVHDAARFSFEDLCETPLSAADFLALAARYPVIFLDRIPRIEKGRKNAVKRFINLVDVLYDQKVRLFFSAEVPIEEIYAAGTGTEKFEFDRTISRLTEMRSADYATESRAACLVKESSEGKMPAFN